MNYIIDFYKELDTFNTILFWGVIIIILLLLIFSIILANKNRKLEKIIESKGINIEDDNELPIKKIDEPKITETKKVEHIPETIIQPIPITEEKTNIGDITPQIVNHERQEKSDYQLPEKPFVAEEYVMSNEQKSIPPFPKTVSEEQPIIKETPVSEAGTYQKNVLREMSLNQTSPIGITRSENKDDIKVKMATELQNNLSENNSNNNSYNQYFNAYKKISDAEIKNNTSQENYLKEVSNKLSEKNTAADLTRTSYELKQEEDAIISYRELMEKKDSLEMVDDEDAIISIDELIKKNKEKIYNITEETENNKFINELKNFRSDL